MCRDLWPSSRSDKGSNESGGKLDFLEQHDRHRCKQRCVSAVRLWSGHPRRTLIPSANLAFITHVPLLCLLEFDDHYTFKIALLVQATLICPFMVMYGEQFPFWKIALFTKTRIQILLPEVRVVCLLHFIFPLVPTWKSWGFKMHWFLLIPHELIEFA